MRDTPTRILVIRRDNIGDLVCTTPLMTALRQQLPGASITALVNHYNRPVLDGNPDVDAVFSYRKAKHRLPGESRLGIYWQRLQMVASLRRHKFDWILLPGGAQPSAMRFARMIPARRILVRDDSDTLAGPHEVEQVCHLLSRMGLAYETPAASVFADADRVAELRRRLTARLGHLPERLIGVHISARKVSQRWPVKSFVELLQRLGDRPGTGFVLLWAPGAENDPAHPGDDGKAAELVAACQGLPVAPVPTTDLGGLIAALSLCDGVICSDGGAMHLAAALGKQIVCFFGQSDAARWGPWGVRHAILQPSSREVGDVSPGEVLEACDRLFA